MGFQEGALGWGKGGRELAQRPEGLRLLLNWVGSRLDFSVAPSHLCPQRFHSEVAGILCPFYW